MNIILNSYSVLYSNYSFNSQLYDYFIIKLLILISFVKLEHFYNINLD